jgi:hypothetical protein
MASSEGRQGISLQANRPLGQQIPPAQCTSLHTRLAEIDAEMADLQARLKRLTVERRPIATTLDAIIYPILTIPPEITAEIFIHYVALDEWVELHNCASRPLLLASICSVWRLIALNLRSIWGNLKISPRSKISAAKKTAAVLDATCRQSSTRPRH